jgi:MoaA/NifB/PqqE/SkfB family radical SAM enzyme
MNKEITNLGTDNLKRVLAFLLMISFAIKELIENFTFAKAVELGFKLAQNQDLLTVSTVALAELRDLDVPETEDVIKFIGINFDLENDSLEQRIEEALDIIPEAYALILANLALYGKVNRIVTNWGKVTEAQVKDLQGRFDVATRLAGGKRAN